MVSQNARGNAECAMGVTVRAARRTSIQGPVRRCGKICDWAAIFFETTPLRFERYARASLISVIFLITGALLCLRASDAIHSGKRRIGVNTADGAAAVKVTAVFPGLPADRAGLRAGDEILAVDGR